MKIEFERLEETVIPHFYAGEGETRARMFLDANGKIMRGSLAPGASIGLHIHATSSEIIYILSGTGKALCDGVYEDLSAGKCHYCPKGHTHSLINDGGEDLVFFAVVPEHRL